MDNKIEITIDVIIHATEDIEKFYTRFEELFDIKKNEFTVQELAGHFDNPIIMLGIKITKKAAKRVIEVISSKISDEVKTEILQSLDQRMDDSSLYMRIAKQEFVEGRIVFDQKNAIKLKIYTPVYRKKEILKVYKDILGFQIK